jgi:hypothetical protein
MHSQDLQTSKRNPLLLLLLLLLLLQAHASPSLSVGEVQ